MQRKPSKGGSGAAAFAGGRPEVGLGSEGSGYMDSDAVRKLKLHYHVNKVKDQSIEKVKYLR